MRAFRFVAAAACLVWSATPLLAEDEQRSGAVMEEVIVTATYRETSLMDTAQSINAVTDDLVEAISA